VRQENGVSYIPVSHFPVWFLYPSHDSGSGDDLSRMPLRVLGDMEQQTEDIGGELRAPDGAWLKEYVIRHRADYVKRFIYLRLCGGDELSGIRRRLAGVALCCQISELFIGQSTSHSIYEQSIDASGDVAQVESYRWSAIGFAPDLGERQAGYMNFDVTARLYQRVRGRHGQWRNPIQRAAQPWFRIFH
jgi:hypothetical protein